MSECMYEQNIIFMPKCICSPIVKSEDDTTNFDSYDDLPPQVFDEEITEEEQSMFNGF